MRGDFIYSHLLCRDFVVMFGLVWSSLVCCVLSLLYLVSFRGVCLPYCFLCPSLLHPCFFFLMFFFFGICSVYNSQPLACRVLMFLLPSPLPLLEVYFENKGRTKFNLLIEHRTGDRGIRGQPQQHSAMYR